MPREPSLYRGLTGLVLLGSAAALATPAWANGWIAISEPSDLTLFALGVAGLVIGRIAARRKPPRD
jgi:hypothetical protein